MARSVKKGPFIDAHLMRKVQALVDTNEKKVVKTWSRRSTIIPEMVNFTFAVQRSPLYPGLRDREHGRMQARRVRGHPDFPESLRRTQGRSEASRQGSASGRAEGARTENVRPLAVGAGPPACDRRRSG